MRWRWYLLVVLGPGVFSLAVAAFYALLGGSFAKAAPPVLGGETPLDYSRVDVGAQEVVDLIGRIEHGVPS